MSLVCFAAYYTVAVTNTLVYRVSTSDHEIDLTCMCVFVY